MLSAAGLVPYIYSRLALITDYDGKASRKSSSLWCETMYHLNPEWMECRSGDVWISWPWLGLVVCTSGSVGWCECSINCRIWDSWVDRVVVLKSRGRRLESTVILRCYRTPIGWLSHKQATQHPLTTHPKMLSVKLAMWSYCASVYSSSKTSSQDQILHSWVSERERERERDVCVCVCVKHLYVRACARAPNCTSG